MEVNCHKHSHTCHKYGCKCRFDFPRYPCLATILAKPLRLTHATEDRQEVYEHVKEVLLPLKEVLEDPKKMEELCEIRKNELDKLYELKLMRHKVQQILDDPTISKQVKKYMEKTIDISEEDLVVEGVQVSNAFMKRNICTPLVDNLEKVSLSLKITFAAVEDSD